MSNKIKSVVKQFAAMVQGDSARVQAEKNYRRADSALKTQIAKLNGETISLEDKVETAKEKASAAIVNGGVLITDETRDLYVRNLISADNELKEAEKKLSKHKELIAFLEAKLEQLNEEEAE
jgi:hypothetical protein